MTTPSRFRLPTAALLVFLAGLGSVWAVTPRTTTPPLKTLSPPGDLNASNGSRNTGILVAWDAPTDSSYFEVYRGLSGNFAQAMHRATSRVPRLNDRQTITGFTYYYWVTAYAPGRYSDPAGPVTGVRGLAPHFVTQPPNVLANLGSNVTITCTARAVPAVTYQWYKGGTLLADANNISSNITTNGDGSQTISLNFNPLKVKDAADRYFVRIKNTTAAINSRFVKVEVIRP